MMIKNSQLTLRVWVIYFLFKIYYVHFYYFEMLCETFKSCKVETDNQQMFSRMERQVQLTFRYYFVFM